MHLTGVCKRLGQHRVEADPSSIHVGEVCSSDSTAHPFLRAIWFTPHTADVLLGNSFGTHEQTTRDLHTLWRETGFESMRCDATQPAEGLYTEMGTEVLPGSGRTSMHNTLE